MTTPTANPADPQLASWCEQLDLVTDQVHQLIQGLSNSQLQWRPAPTKWSIAECLEHLAITARKGASRWVPAIAAGRRAGQLAAGPFAFGWLGKWFIGLVGPNPKRPVPAPAVFAPPGSVDPAQASADFFQSQSELHAILGSADGLDLGRIKARSAAMALLRLNLATWFASTVAHQQRHLEQLRRVRNAAGFPGV